MRHARRSAALLGALLGFVGCNDEGLSPRAIPVHMAVTGGATQAGRVGQPLDSALTVQVTDQRDQPVSGVIVTFTVPPGAGTLSRTATTTDAQGLARSRWTLPTVTGAYEANVKASGLDSLVFVASARAGTPASVAIIGENLVAVPADSGTGHPVAVEVRDAFENLVRGASVTFATRGGGEVQPARVTTDSNGRAVARWLPGPDSAAGRLEIRADTLPPLSLHPTPAPPSLSLTPPESTPAPVGTEEVSAPTPIVEAPPEQRAAWGWPARPADATLICWQNALGVTPLDGGSEGASACEALGELP